MLSGFGSENLKKRKKLHDLGTDEIILLEWVVKK